jgi:hypothetical protein
MPIHGEMEEGHERYGPWVRRSYSMRQVMLQERYRF